MVEIASPSPEYRLSVEVVAIDPKALTVVARLGKAEGSGALRYASGGLWTSAHDVHTLTWWPEPILVPAN